MASSYRLCHQLTAFCHLLNRRSRTNIINKKISFLYSPFSPSPTLPFLKPSSSSSSSVSFEVTAVGTDAAALSQSPPPAAAAASSAVHAWPEWDQFVDKMRTKGYFAKTQQDASASDVTPPAALSSYSSAAMDQNRIKNACLAFARERYDIIRSLPKEDIQAIVECGCPNLYRKSVNSAKRLRAFVRLDEGEVCGACNLRGSCDRAYVIEKDIDQARTVDIVRILMSYAGIPTLQSGGTNPSITEAVQESARKLLGELIKLSDTTIDPTLPKPVGQPASKKETSEKSEVTNKSKNLEVTNMSKNLEVPIKSKNLEVTNMSKNLEVPNKSKNLEVTNKSKHSQNVEMKRGDWICSNCNILNFARNVRCLECRADGPKRVDFAGAEMKLGDWTCPKCKFMNFACNKECFRCQKYRPKSELNPGEWKCPRCHFLNFRRNTICKECNGQRPADKENNEFEDHAWKNPRMTRNNNNAMNFGDTFAGAEMKLGDWTCPKCEFMNFARNKECFRCLKLRPKRELNPGEWECPRCDFLNFRRNTICKKCNGQRPADNQNSGFEDHAWKNPRMTRNNNNAMNFGDTFVVSKRGAPAEKRSNSARKQNNFL